MKYMGSKTALLRGELGKIVLKEAKSADRFVDLFAGSASVGHYVAERLPVSVMSVDLQRYSAILADSITGRTASCRDSVVVSDWTKGVADELAHDAQFANLALSPTNLDRAAVLRSRELSSLVESGLFITKHYGGHYFSPQQSYVLDALYRKLPDGGDQRQIGLAALLRTASQIAAAPGHTAQPFQPTQKLLPYIRTAWMRDVLKECQRHVDVISMRHALKVGTTRTGEATEIAGELNEGDVVFCDPPYSAVQYSRFYHVLEGISVGGWSEVFGAGRAPAHELRASSAFSMVGSAQEAMATMLSKLREQRCTVIITFPDADASNGLSAAQISGLARRDWNFRTTRVESSHSTLGGSARAGARGGRKELKEAVIVLRPRN